MSQMQAAKGILAQIDMIDKQHGENITNTEEITQIFYDLKDPNKALEIYLKGHSKYHITLSKWVNSLITVSPYLPNNLLPNPETPNPQAPQEQESQMLNSISEKMHESVLFSALILVIPSIIFGALVALDKVPWVIPVLYGVGFTGLYFTPQIIQSFQALSKSDADKDVDSLYSNPAEWISKELQKMSDSFDGIRGLVILQNVEPSDLPEAYKNKNPVLYSRLHQEMEFFPNEALEVIRKLTVFSNNAYQDRKGFLINCLKPAPQMNAPAQVHVG